MCVLQGRNRDVLLCREKSALSWASLLSPRNYKRVNVFISWAPGMVKRFVIQPLSLSRSLSLSLARSLSLSVSLSPSLSLCRSYQVRLRWWWVSPEIGSGAGAGVNPPYLPAPNKSSTSAVRGRANPWWAHQPGGERWLSPSYFFKSTLKALKDSWCNHTHTHTCQHAHACTHTRMHTPTRTLTNAHTHSCLTQTSILTS